MKKRTVPVPEPIVTQQVCSVCGESWLLHIADEHGEVPVTECIRILKAMRWSPTLYQPVWPQPIRVWYTSGGNIEGGTTPGLKSNPPSNINTGSGGAALRVVA